MKNALVIGFGLTLLSVNSCKQSQSTDLSAIVGIAEDGKNVALGLLAVHQEQKLLNFDSPANDLESRQLKAFLQLPYFALVECFSFKNPTANVDMSPEQVMIAAETASGNGNFKLTWGEDSNSRILVSHFIGGTPALSPNPCRVVGSRLWSWPVIASSSLLISATIATKVKPDDSIKLEEIRKNYLFSQSIYLALRGSIVKGTAAMPPLSNLKMLSKWAEMAIRHETGQDANLSVRAEAFRQQAIGFDAIFNPCFTQPSSEWFVQKWRTANYECVDDPRNPQLQNYKPKGDYIQNRNALASRASDLHAELFSKRNDARFIRDAWDAVTSVRSFKTQAAKNGFAKSSLTARTWSEIKSGYQTLNLVPQEGNQFELHAGCAGGTCSSSGTTTPPNFPAYSNDASFSPPIMASQPQQQSSGASSQNSLTPNYPLQQDSMASNSAPPVMGSLPAIQSQLSTPSSTDGWKSYGTGMDGAKIQRYEQQVALPEYGDKKFFVEQHYLPGQSQPQQFIVAPKNYDDYLKQGDKYNNWIQVPAVAKNGGYAVADSGLSLFSKSYTQGNSTAAPGVPPMTLPNIPMGTTIPSLEIGDISNVGNVGTFDTPPPDTLNSATRILQAEPDPIPQMNIPLPQVTSQTPQPVSWWNSFLGNFARWQYGYRR